MAAARAGRITSVTIWARGGVEEQGFGAGVHFGMGQVEQELADAVADTGSARLAGGEHSVPGRAQMLGQQVNLGGLAAAIRPFKGDKHTIDS